jgi:OHCU decarboxylase
MRLDELNTLDDRAAAAALLSCCGSERWAQRMAAARPFADAAAMAAAADRIWASMDPADWLQAFAAHPRIGERTRSDWEAREQSGVAAADAADFDSLNHDYEARFGYIFIVCAAGRSAGDLRAALERRLRNDPGDELREAVEEQRQITQLRLARLIA